MIFNPTMKSQLIALFFLCFITASNAQNTPDSKDSTAQKKTAKTKQLGPLFESEEVLPFTILSNLKVLLKDRGEKPSNHWGQIEYSATNENPTVIPIKMKVRGNFRRLSKNCMFPPLLLDIDKKKKGNSVFDYQNKLKLVTHCINEDYILQEYLVYKMYNLLTNYSFKARLSQVTYRDSAANREPETKRAFLLEDETDLAKRNGAKVSNLKQLRPNQLDTLSMATLSVFEYLIGNTDWSVPFLHNVKLFREEGRYLIAVPYDFDHAGIIQAKYAVPSEYLSIVSVRDRLYRGINYPPAIFQQVFDNFRKMKPQLYALYVDNPQLKPSYIKHTVKYLDEFYKVIDSPKAVQQQFVQPGKENGSGTVVVKGLK